MEDRTYSSPSRPHAIEHVCAKSDRDHEIFRITLRGSAGAMIYFERLLLTTPMTYRGFFSGSSSAHVFTLDSELDASSHAAEGPLHLAV